MRRTTAVLIVLAAAVLLPAGPVAAKELTTLSVCGADGCVGRTGLLRHADRGHGGLLDLGIAMADPGTAPFVRLKLGIGDGGGRVFGGDVIVFVPRSGLVRAGDGVWYRPSPASLRLFRRAARGVARMPAARLRPAAVRPQRTAPVAPVRAAAPVHRGAAPVGGDGPSGGLVAGLGALALALLVATGVLVVRRRRPAGAEGRPAAG